MNAIIFAEPFFLHTPRLDDTLTYHLAGFALRRLRNVVEGTGVISIWISIRSRSRTRDFVHIPLNLSRRADTVMRGVAVISAGTRIHARHKHERARIFYRIFGTGDSYLAIFERLAQHFERVLLLNSGNSSAKELRCEPMKSRLVAACFRLPRERLQISCDAELRNGRCEMSDGLCPTCPRCCVSAWSPDFPPTRGGRMEGRRFAIIDLPEPGGPIIIMLCPPAAATSIACFTFS